MILKLRLRNVKGPYEFGLKSFSGPQTVCYTPYGLKDLNVLNPKNSLKGVMGSSKYFLRKFK